jgi:phage tail sheath protein FI
MEDDKDLIDAAAAHLKYISENQLPLQESSRAFAHALKECHELVRVLVPEEQIQVAAAIVSLCKRTLLHGGDAEDAQVGRKLETIERQLDNLANSL